MDLLFRQFRAHAVARPEQPALSCPGGALTYGELADRAQHLAAGLRAAGVGRGDRVGLCLDWTPDLLAAVIGAWEAGAAYVPLDPSLPRARLAAIVEQARPVALVAASHWQGALPGAAAPVYTPAELEARCDSGFVDDTVVPADLAYVMFTSGTSGQPKGVCVSHGNLAGLFTPFAEQFHLHCNDAWSLCHSYGFGYSIWETWGGLSTGARLVPVPAAWRADPAQLQSLLAEQGVTILSQTPSAFRQTVLHEAFDLAGLNRLRLVALSGEAVPAADVERWFRQLGEHDARLINT